MSLIYVGVTEFTLQKTSRAKAVEDIARFTETWAGRPDLQEEFMAQFIIGEPYKGGYIIDVRGEDPQGAYATVDIIVARAPDFQSVTLTNATTVKTASKSARGIEASGIMPPMLNPEGDLVPVTVFDAERRVTYRTVETKYTYFASARPAGPRYTTAPGTQQPVILSSSIIATGASGQVPFRGATAPLPIVSALSMAVSTEVIHEAQGIPGTPWFRCVDSVAIVLKGDES